MRYKDRDILERVEGWSLDVGCGDVKLGDVGVDVRDGEDVDYVVDRGEKYPFDSDSFDTVICSEVLEHTADPEFILSEVRRVLRPGGTLLVSVPNSGNVLFRLGVWRQPSSAGLHVRFWTDPEFRTFLVENEFRPVEVVRSWYHKNLVLPQLATCLLYRAEVDAR